MALAVRVWHHSRTMIMVATDRQRCQAPLNLAIARLVMPATAAVVQLTKPDSVSNFMAEVTVYVRASAEK